MSNPIVDIIGGAIGPVVDSVLSAYKHKGEVKLKGIELENARDKIAGELRLKVLKELHKPQSELYDFVIAYEGAGDKQPKLIQWLRSSVRPLVTYWAIIIITLLMFDVISGQAMQENFEAIPEQMWTIFLTIFGFWFGGRALMQVAETWQKGTLNTTRANNRVAQNLPQNNDQNAMVNQQNRQVQFEAETRPVQKNKIIAEDRNLDLLESDLFD